MSDRNSKRSESRPDPARGRRLRLRRRPSVEGLEGRTLLTYGGSLDLTFGDLGMVPSTASFPQNYSAASALQADGKLVVVGMGVEPEVGFGGTYSQAFVANRYNADGTPDSSFSNSTLPDTPSLAPSTGGFGPRPAISAGATGVALQSDNKILVVGNVNGVAKLIRLDADGTFDTGFGTGGIITLGTVATNDGLLDYASAVAVLPDGEIAVGGATTPTAGHDTPAVEVFHADGTVDTSYGTNGLATVPLPANATAFATIASTLNGTEYSSPGVANLIAQADGKLVFAVDAVLAGTSGKGEAVLTRFSAAGAADTSFGAAGQVTIAPQSILPSAITTTIGALAEQPDGKLVLGGSILISPDQFTTAVSQNLAVRLDANGTLDSTFGIGGASIARAIPALGGSTGAIAIQPDGKIVLANRYFASYVRLDADGLPDPTFGEGGTATLSTDYSQGAGNSPRAGAVGLAITASGKILVTGSDYLGSIYRLLGQGAAGDFNGDGLSDPAIYDTALAQFTYFSSIDGTTPSVQFGSPGLGNSLPAPGAYAGGGQDELAVYLPAAGGFAVESLVGGSNVFTPFGTPGAGNSLPAEGDYDLSGKTEYAVYLPNIGAFAYRPANGGNDVIVGFGTPGKGQSIPAPADYFGNGQTDLAVYLPSLGAFAIRNPFTNQDTITPFGEAGAGKSIPVPGDYDGSGHAELAVYLPDYQALLYQPASGGPPVAEYFGPAGAGMTLPAPGDYDGSGQTDVAAYLPAQGRFAFRPAGGGPDVSFAFGTPNQTVPYALASATDSSASGSSGFGIRAASVEIPLTPDVLDSLNGTPAKKVGRPV